MLCPRFPRERHRQAPIGKFTLGKEDRLLCMGRSGFQKKGGRQLRRPQDNTHTRYYLSSVAEQADPIEASSDSLRDDLVTSSGYRIGSKKE
jgi:hypothetical protein